MKDHRREGSRFSLVMYGFYGSIALYSASLFFKKCLLVFQIKSKCYKKAFNIDFLSSKNEEITLPHEFIFVFVWSFIGALLSETSCQKHGVQKKY